MPKVEGSSPSHRTPSTQAGAPLLIWGTTVDLGCTVDLGVLMAWRGPRSGASRPGYHTKGWAKIKGYWRSQRLPCSRCGCTIDYDGSYMIMDGGRRTVNPHYLVVGHMVSVATATALGWPDSQTYALANTRPECWTCSNRSGARSGNRRHRSSPSSSSMRRSGSYKQLSSPSTGKINSGINAPGAKGGSKESLTPTSTQVHTSRW